MGYHCSEDGMDYSREQESAERYARENGERCEPCNCYTLDALCPNCESCKDCCECKTCDKCGQKVTVLAPDSDWCESCEQFHGSTITDLEAMVDAANGTTTEAK